MLIREKYAFIGLGGGLLAVTGILLLLIFFGLLNEEAIRNLFIIGLPVSIIGFILIIAGAIAFYYVFTGKR